MKRSLYKNQRGQLIVEYILLLAMAAVVSGIVVNKLASRNPDEPGAIITGWTKVIQAIGLDPVDECMKSNCPPPK